MRLLYKWWRVIGTGFSFAVFGIGAFVIALILSIVIYPIPLSKSLKRMITRRSLSFATKVYVRMMWCLGLLRFEFYNEKSLNVGGQLVVANHPSLLDVVFLISVMPRTTCIVKSALWKNPFTAGVVNLAGYIPNSDNGEELVEKAVAAIESGETLIVFPEGTRTVDPENLKFQRGAANIAIKARCPVVPVIVNCQPMTLRKHQKWYQVPDIKPTFSFRVMEPLAVEDCIDLEKPKSVQARNFSSYLKRYISDELAKL